MKKILKGKYSFNWNLISENLFKKFKIEKTAKQCRERYNNHLNPKIKRDEWSLQENKKLFNLHEKYGNHWTKISSNIKGRTENSIKNQFFSITKKILRKLNKLTINKKERNLISK